MRPLYAKGSRPSADPVVFFKLRLIMFFEGLRSERELMRVATDRLSVRWCLGYDLHEPLPDHSNMMRTRDRCGLPVFRRFFEEIVQRCAEAGLVRGRELFFDSTKVGADADVDSLASRHLVENHLGGLFEDEAVVPETSEQGTPAATAALSTADDPQFLEGNAGSSDWVSRAGSQDRAFVSGTRKRTADLRVSRTDPDATPMRVGAGETKLGYQAHYVVDPTGQALQGEGQSLPCLLVQAEVHSKQGGTHDLLSLRRTLLGQGEELPPDPPLPKSPAQAQGVGGAALRRGERLPRHAEV